MKYIWDTNIAIYYLQQQLPLNAEQFIDDLIALELPFISSMTEIELLCWKDLSNQQTQVINQFIAGSVIIDLEKKVKIQTIEIRKRHKIKLPDAIIAASALVYSLTLLTRNVKDFVGINDLKILNPLEE